MGGGTCPAGFKIHAWQMGLAILNKLTTALHLKCLCSLELNVKKYCRGGNQATPKRARWKTLHDCRDVEVVAVKPSTPVPAVPLFLDPFAHYIVFISAMSKIP